MACVSLRNLLRYLKLIASLYFFSVCLCVLETLTSLSWLSLPSLFKSWNSVKLTDSAQFTRSFWPRFSTNLINQEETVEFESSSEHLEVFCYALKCKLIYLLCVFFFFINANSWLAIHDHSARNTVKQCCSLIHLNLMNN